MATKSGCVLPELSDDLETFLGSISKDDALKDRMFETPATLAIWCALDNRDKPPAQQFRAGDIATQANEHFQLTDDRALTPQKIGKLVKHPETVLSALQQEWQQRQAEATAASSPEPEFNANPERAPAADQSAPQSDYVHPGLAQMTLLFMEAAARMHNDPETEKHLRAINRDLSGNDQFENPLIKIIELPDKIGRRVSAEIEAGRQREAAVKNAIGQSIGQFLGAAHQFGRNIATRAQEDLMVLQSAGYVLENMNDDPTVGQEQRAGVIERLQTGAAMSER